MVLTLAHPCPRGDQFLSPRWRPGGKGRLDRRRPFPSSSDRMYLRRTRSQRQHRFRRRHSGPPRQPKATNPTNIRPSNSAPRASSARSESPTGTRSSGSATPTATPSDSSIGPLHGAVRRYAASQPARDSRRSTLRNRIFSRSAGVRNALFTRAMTAEGSLMVKSEP